MAEITLKELSTRVGLEPKVIRRILRKQFKNAFSSGRYVLDDGNDLCKKIIEACKAYTTKPAKSSGVTHTESGEPKEEKWSKRTAMDDRGFFLTDGKIFAIATIPQPHNPHVSDMKTVYLGKAEDLLPILNREVARAPEFSTSEQQLAWEGLLDGSSAAQSNEELKDAPKAHIKGVRHRRRKK